MATLVAWLILAVLPSIARAATFTVNTTVDLTDLVPGDGRCRTVIGSCSLRAAIQETNALEGDDRIILPAGAFILNRLGSLEDSAATGDLDINGDLIISGASGGSTIQGAEGWDDRMLHIRGDAAVTIGFVTIRGGILTEGSESGSAGEGGGVFVESEATLRLTDSTVENNQVNSAGGGISSLGTLGIWRSRVGLNIARRGAGIAVRGGTTTLTDSIVIGNAATARPDDLFAEGGGILLTGGNLTLLRSTVTRNSVLGERARGGGGIKADSSNELSIVQLTDSTVSDNTSHGNGGGILNTGVSRLFVIRSTISGNSTDYYCGGISNSSRVPLTLAVRITNSTISGNSAVHGGGGLCHVGFHLRRMELNYVTVTGNAAAGGGGIITKDPMLGADPVFVENTIIAGNFSNGTSPDCEGLLRSRGFNLIQNTLGCSIDGVTTGNITGRSPRLGPLGSHGGPTLTHLPQSFPFPSPAIDNGNPDSGEALDQRGVTRPRDGNGDGIALRDIGAVEVGSGGSAGLLLPQPSTQGPAVCTFELDVSVPRQRAREPVNLVKSPLPNLEHGQVAWSARRPGCS
jgi:CSLREA domain-containing protein